MGDGSDIEKVHALDVRIVRLEEQYRAKEKALELIAISLADYKTTANEWRGTVQDIIGKNPTRAEMQTLFERLGDKVSSLERAENKNEGKSSGFSLSWGIVIAIVGLGLTLMLVLVGIAAMVIRK
jgi:hypothetical protein